MQVPQSFMDRSRGMSNGGWRATTIPSGCRVVTPARWESRGRAGPLARARGAQPRQQLQQQARGAQQRIQQQTNS